MKIKLADLASNQLLRLTISEPWEGFEALQDLGSQGIRFEGPVSGALRLERSGEMVETRGILHLQAFLACDRCLEEQAVPLEAEVDLALCLHPGDEELTEERELSEEELGLEPVVGDELDLRPLLAEQLILALPAKVLCREDCRGLCPQCGQNLNDGPCDCGGSPMPGPFDVLKKLKLDS